MKKIFILPILLLFCVSCEKMFMEPDPEGTPTETFEYLWNKVDQQYAFFDVKEVDWDSIHTVYSAKISDDISSDSLFAVLGSMLNNLNDGHVNLIGRYDVSRSEQVFNLMYERRQIDTKVVALNYLTSGYHSTGGFQHNGLRNDSVVYIRYSSFSNSASISYLNYIRNYYPHAQGFIIDVRQNGGGNVDNVWEILKFFSRPETLLYKTQIKSGPKHNEFSPLEEVYAPQPDDRVTPFSKPVVVLQDRGSYSATSFFSLCCLTYPTITTLGDTTGGGLGLPNGGQLPNGWYYRFSITRTLSPDGKNYENGVSPNEYLALDPAATAAGKDNIIERAADIILQ